MTAGAFKLWPLSRDAKLIGYKSRTPTFAAGHSEATGQDSGRPQVPDTPTGPGQPAAPQPPPKIIGPSGAGGSAAGSDDHLLETPDPSNPAAYDIYFGVKTDATPPKDQIDLQDKVQRVLRTVQVLYRKTDSESERNTTQFRIYYVRLYRLAQLGLEGSNVAPDIATAALESTTSDLIDDEAATVKRTHLRILGRNAATASALYLLVYILMRLIAFYWTSGNAFLFHMGVSTLLVANFMLLLAGCSVGVWLSYGIRTTTFKLSDLTVTDSDRLTPVIRLIFAGSLTLILGIVFAIPLVEVKIGTIPVTNIATFPMLAFVVGCFCGVSELALPAAISKRASDFIQSIK